MNYFLASFGLHNPFIKAELPEHSIFPISSENSNGVDLDYTSLLLGTGYSIDMLTYDYICSNEKAFLSPMARTLTFLKKEGFLNIIDVKKIVSENEQTLINKVNQLAEYPEVWINIFKRQWKNVKHEYYDFQSAYGRADKSIINTCNFPVYNYLSSIGEQDNKAKLESISRLIEVKKNHYTKQEILLLRDVVKPLIAQILINDLVRTKFNIPVLDWDDNEDYYSQLYVANWQLPGTEHRISSQSHKLFDCVIPSLKPQNVESVVKFISDDKAVKSLRSELWRTINENEEVSHIWYENFTNKLYQKELNYKNKMKRFRWLGLALGLIPTGGIIWEAIIEIAKTLGEDKVEEAVFGDFQWYYTLQKEASQKNLPPHL